MKSRRLKGDWYSGGELGTEDYERLVVRVCGCHMVLTLFRTGRPALSYSESLGLGVWWGLDAKGRVVFMSEFVRRGRKAVAKKQVALSKGASEWAKAHPALWEYLSLHDYGDGKPRLTSTLLLFVEGGVWKACLNDRQEREVLWQTAASLEEVLEALEECLVAGTGEWRASKPFAGNGEVKKK